MGMTIKGRTGDLGGDGTFYSLTVVAGTPTYTCDKTTQTTHTHTHTHTGGCQVVKSEGGLWIVPKVPMPMSSF